VLQSEEKVFAVFRGQSGNFQLDSGQIDAFVLAEGSSVDDLANDLGAPHLQDAQFDQTVRQKDAISAVHFTRQRPEDGADTRGIAQDLGSGDNEALSGTQHYRPAARKRAGANLWALEVSENGDWFFLFDSGSAQGNDILRMVRVRAMRKIQAGDVHARFQESADHARGATGWPDGANDFGVTKNHTLS
jgi:hypothetical protein